MNLFCVLLLFFQLFYLTSCIYNKLSVSNVEKKNNFFRKDYRLFESRQSFYKFHTTHRNWLDAKKRCTLEGASMWYPEDQEEVDLMVEYWKERQPALLKLHVGVSDLISEGQWETVDGKPVEEIWNKWGPGEPNNAIEGENCGLVRRDFYTPGGIDLIDESCSFLQPFICKKTLASLDWNYLCDMPDLKYIFEIQFGKCYKLHLKPLSWNEAYTVCAAEESYLAVINSKKEKDSLVKMIADAHTEKIPGDFLRLVHLGFHNKFGEGWNTVSGTDHTNRVRRYAVTVIYATAWIRFTHTETAAVKGIPYPTNLFYDLSSITSPMAKTLLAFDRGTSLDESGYVVWGNNQPNGGDKEPCGAMFFDGTFNDVGCDKRAFFICEHDISLLSNALDERISSI